MNARIYFLAICRVIVRACVLAAVLCGAKSSVLADTGLLQDPATGNVYRPVTRTIDRPTVETKMEKRQQTFFRPETVTEIKPESRTVYTPVVEYKWEPRLHGRWNPFQQPTVVYHHVPSTHWEARTDVVQRSNTRTQWIAEQRTIEVPHRIVKMQRESKTDYQLVGQLPPKPSTESNLPAAIASRLRPLPSSLTVPARLASTRVAAASIGRSTSDLPPRTSQQGGLRATELYRTAPSAGGQGLPPVNTGAGIATRPSALPFFR